MAIENLGIMKWLHENGVTFVDKKIFSYAAMQGDIEIIKWLKVQGCPWGGDTFSHAAIHGDIVNMKWLKEHGVKIHFLMQPFMLTLGT